jgi:AcrR family transcriptional regulator
MPATRPHLNRDLKRKQILDAAEKLFLRDGYEATAMAAIARCAGVANNAVYWYFPSKDDLVAAVLQRRQERAFAELPAPTTSTVQEQVLAMLAQLDQVANLTATVHERAKHSTTVAEMHEAFHRRADRLLQSLFRDAGLDEDDATQAAKAMMALIEGIHLHEARRDRAARNDLVLWAFRRLAPAARDGATPPRENGALLSSSGSTGRSRS